MTYLGKRAMAVLRREFAVTAEPSRLQEHMIATYHGLRMGLFLVAAILPVFLLLTGWLLNDPLRCSMSAYYHGPTLIRDVFVGALIAIGALLFLYKGFSPQENLVLNCAAAFAVGIALVPTSAECLQGGRTLSPHGILAVLFFGCIAYVCVFRASDTLSLVTDKQRARRLDARYKVLGVLMIALPILAAGLALAVRSTWGKSAIFAAEWAAV